MTELRTARLLLRGWRDEDLPAFAALNADPRVMEHMPSVLSRQDSDALAGRIRVRLGEEGLGLWAVEVPGRASFIGFAGLARPTFDAPFLPAVEVGWRLSQEHWGQGFATEAAQAAVAHGFGTLGLAEILSFTVPGNLRSRRVMEKLGMRHDPAADFDHPRVPPDSPLRRHVLYRLERAAWRQRRLASIRLVDGTLPEHIEVVRALFRAYEQDLGVDLCFQGFADELATLPGAYAPPRGRILLALAGEEPVGCVALRPLSADVAEMKRLFLRPSVRALGLGRRLALAILEAARALGYRSMKLDTLPSMTPAIALYRSLGFEEVPPYCHNPVPGALYLEVGIGGPRQM